MRVFGVILAGGEGRRMGGADKALVRLSGQTLAARAAARLGPQVERLAISANGKPARFADLGLPVLADADPAGPLSGVLTGLSWAAGAGADAIVTVAVDTPFFPCDLVPRLCLAAETVPAGLAIAESGGRTHPVFGLWPVALRADLQDFLPTSSRVMDFARRHGAAQAPFPDDGAFMNLNTPDDLCRAEAMLKGAA